MSHNDAYSTVHSEERSVWVDSFHTTGMDPLPARATGNNPEPAERQPLTFDGAHHVFARHDTQYPVPRVRDREVSETQRAEHDVDPGGREISLHGEWRLVHERRHVQHLPVLAVRTWIRPTLDPPAPALPMLKVLLFLREGSARGAAYDGRPEPSPRLFSGPERKLPSVPPTHWVPRSYHLCGEESRRNLRRRPRRRPRRPPLAAPPPRSPAP
mmetsp:Transcript_39409/g.63158  ORF Transcript_39409/g.63158 Transcript_39409/m.63158 type:complete len:213 (-) Transcript_39409:100-738(-)